MTLSRIGPLGLRWGESIRWDDRRQRLYFVDCATQTLHWLDQGELPLGALPLASLPTGLCLTGDGRLLACLDEGLVVIDPDRSTTEVLAPYPARMHGRANDMNADPEGNAVTGTLNMGPGPGSLWQFSARHGWRQLDEGTGNTNGPVFTSVEGDLTLVVADTVARRIHAYAYDPTGGTVGERRVVGGHLAGVPDGATVDAQGTLWWCLIGAGQLIRLSVDGSEIDSIPLPSLNPSDVTFGGPRLDLLYVTSIAFDLGGGSPGDGAGDIVLVEGTDAVGIAEYRFDL